MRKNRKGDLSAISTAMVLMACMAFVGAFWLLVVSGITAAL
jgi:hypothetical protein